LVTISITFIIVNIITMISVTNLLTISISMSFNVVNNMGV